MFQTQEQFSAWVKEFCSASDSQRSTLAIEVGIWQSYYESIQYIQSIGVDNYFNRANLRSMPTNLNPDKSRLRLTCNRITKFIVKAATSTRPSKFDVTVEPPSRASSVGGANNAQRQEDLLSMAIERCGLLSAAQDANHKRCIEGTHGVYLRQTVKGRSYGQEQGETRDIEAVSCHPTRIVLDPAKTDRDLTKHDAVVYRDIWNIYELKRAFPGMFDDPKVVEEMKTVGELSPLEQQVAALSRGRVFSNYATFSRTKGAIVVFCHIKDDTGRFGWMYTGIDTGNGEPKCVNLENGRSPWGGCGLPLAVLHGHPRSDSFFSFSDVWMMKDDQDMLNLATTWQARHSQRYTGYQYVVDKRWFTRAASDDDIRSMLTNTVAGVIIGGGSSDRTVQGPQLMQTPPPSPFFQDMRDRSESSMRDQSFRSEGNFGAGAKSHVPNSTVETLLRESDQVLDARVSEDVKEYNRLFAVLLGTEIRNVQLQSVGTLERITADGFDAQDIAAVFEMNPDYPGCSIRTNEASIRQRSAGERRKDLQEAMQAQVLSPADVRFAMANLDMPLTEDDGYMRIQIGKAVGRLILGEPWTPMDFGEFSQWCISLLVKAQTDNRVRENPELLAAVQQALAQQRQITVQATLASDPQMAAQQMQMEQQAAMQQQQEQQAAAQAAEQQQALQPQNLGELMDMLTGGGLQGQMPMEQPAPV